jgi:hypothetical protein
LELDAGTLSQIAQMPYGLMRPDQITSDPSNANRLCKRWTVTEQLTKPDHIPQFVAPVMISGIL